MDAIIAATALAHDLSVWTQDGEFDVLAELLPALRLTEADLSLRGGTSRGPRPALDGLDIRRNS